MDEAFESVTKLGNEVFVCSTQGAASAPDLYSEVWEPLGTIVGVVRFESKVCSHAPLDGKGNEIWMEQTESVTTVPGLLVAGRKGGKPAGMLSAAECLCWVCLREDPKARLGAYYHGRLFGRLAVRPRETEGEGVFYTFRPLPNVLNKLSIHYFNKSND